MGNNLSNQETISSNHIIFKLDNLSYTDYQSNKDINRYNQSILSKTKKEEINDSKTKIYEINEKNKDTVYFHLEKITFDNTAKWKKIVESFNTFPSRLILTKNEKYILSDDENLQFIDVVAGSDFFEQSLHHAHGPLGSGDHDLFIAYVSPKQQINSMDDIEIMFTVVGNQQSCITTHMGIFKNPFYYTDDLTWSGIDGGYNMFCLRKNININRDNIHNHPNISVKLHIFAGYMIQKYYTNIQGMITSPTPSMLAILQKALKNNIYGVELKKDLRFKRTPSSLNGNVIFKYNTEDNEMIVIAEITKKGIFIFGQKYKLPPWQCSQLKWIEQEDTPTPCYITETTNNQIFIPYKTFEKLFNELNFVFVSVLN